MTRLPGCAPLLLQLGLVEVTAASGQFVAGLAFQLLEGCVVAVVVLLHDLEGPTALDDVAADQLAFDPVGPLVVPGLAQQPYGVVQLEVGVPVSWWKE